MRSWLKRYANRGSEEGSALIMVIWITFILSILLLSVTDRLTIERALYSEFDVVNEARRNGHDLLQLVIAKLQADETEYDIPEEMFFSLDELRENDFSGVTVELWDEGSRFNPNNAPLPLLSAYFQGESEAFDLIYAWLFNTDDYGELIVRNDYFLSNAELKIVLSGDDQKESPLLNELTVFGPAVLSLIDGEVMLSLLQRWGEDYNQISGLRIINEFNQNRRELKNLTSFTGIASRLQIDMDVEEELINDLLITEGGINPNFVNTRFLNAIFAETETEFDDISEYREDKPFIDRSGFEFYLQVIHNVSISKEEIWKIFTLETRIWGLNITVPISTERFFQIKAVLRRERDELVARARGGCRIKVLYYNEEIGINDK